MRYRKLFLLIGGLGVGFMLGGLILWIGTPRLNNSAVVQNTLPKVGSSIPGFELPDTNGKKMNNTDYLGKPLIINFWATWCAPCKLEMPLLQKTAQKFGQDVNLIAVNFEESKDTVVQYVNKNNFVLPIMLDESGVMANSFGVRVFPVTFFIDKYGVLQSIHIGQLDEKLIQTYIKTIGITE